MQLKGLDAHMAVSSALDCWVSSYSMKSLEKTALRKASGMTHTTEAQT